MSDIGIDIDPIKNMMAGHFKYEISELIKLQLEIKGCTKNDVLKWVMEATYDCLFHMPPEEAEQLLDKFKENPNQFRDYLKENFTGR